MFLVLTFVVYVILGFVLLKKVRLYKRGIKVKAEVVGYDNTSDPDRYYRPIIKYRTLDGQQIIKTLDTSATWKLFSEFAIIEIVYDPEDPENVTIFSFILLFAIFYVVLIICLIFYLAYHPSVLSCAVAR